MKTEFYLIATSYGAGRMTKRRPSLARDEIGIRVRMTIPDGAFRSPILTVDLEVADDAVLQPEVAMEVVWPPSSDDQPA